MAMILFLALPTSTFALTIGPEHSRDLTSKFVGTVTSKPLYTVPRNGSAVTVFFVQVMQVINGSAVRIGDSVPVYYEGFGELNLTIGDIVFVLGHVEQRACLTGCPVGKVTLAVVVSPQNDEYVMDESKPSPWPWSITVATDKPNYLPTEIILINGTVVGGTMAWVATCAAPLICAMWKIASNVTIRIVRQDGTVVFQAEMPLSSENPPISHFSMTFDNTSLSLGVYTILAEASALGLPMIQAAATFTVVSKIRPLPISLSVSPTSASIDPLTKPKATIMITGLISRVPAAAFVMLTITGPTGSTTTAAIVRPDGSFTYLFTPTESGTYTISASYAGDSAHEPTQSAPTSVLVTTDWISIIIMVGVVIAVAGVTAITMVRRRAGRYM
jgi:hypothetical protein